MKRSILFLVLVFAISSSPPAGDTDASAANIALVKQAYDGFAVGDIPAVVATFAENVEWNEAENFPYADGNPYIGGDAIVNGVFARIGGEWDGFKLVNLSVHAVDGDMVLATGRYNGTFKGTGKAVDAQFAHVFWLKDGKIAKFQQYTDTEQFDEVTDMDENDDGGGDEGEGEGEEETGS